MLLTTSNEEKMLPLLLLEQAEMLHKPNDLEGDRAPVPKLPRVSVSVIEGTGGNLLGCE